MEPLVNFDRANIDLTLPIQSFTFYIPKLTQTPIKSLLQKIVYKTYCRFKVAVLHQNQTNSYNCAKRDDFATHLFKSNFKKCSTGLPSTMLRTLDEDFYVLFVCIARFLGVKMNCYLALREDGKMDLYYKKFEAPSLYRERIFFL